MDFTLFMPTLINMNVHSAICSWSVELYKQWFTLADFLPNWDISRGFLYISNIHIITKIVRTYGRTGKYMNFDPK